MRKKKLTKEERKIDIHQVEKKESQRAALLKYENSISLSKSKMVFGRRVNEKSIVLRNLYPTIEDLQSAGVDLDNFRGKKY